MKYIQLKNIFSIKDNLEVNDGMVAVVVVRVCAGVSGGGILLYCGRDR